MILFYLVIFRRLNFEMKNKKIKMNSIIFFSLLINLVSSQVEETKAKEISNFVTKDFIFDLAKSKPAKTDGNTIRVLTLALFPVLAHSGVTFALVELEPCGINLPHLHPRATEILFVGFFLALQRF